MIKSKRKTTVYAKKTTKATWFVDSFHNWDYEGFTKNMGEKYKSSNPFVNESNYPVKKGYKQGKDLVDA
jgi:hypothetical protein